MFGNKDACSIDTSTTYIDNIENRICIDNILLHRERDYSKFRMNLNLL